MARVLLVLPQASCEEGRFVCPPGIAYISAALKKTPGLEVVHLNLNDEAERQEHEKRIVSSLREEKIDMVFSGGMGADYHSLRMIFKTAKQYKDAIPTVVGGVIVSGDPVAAMEALEFADYGILGEGEQTASQLALALGEGGSPENAAGLVYRHAQGWGLSPPRRVMTDWSEIPWPDYESFGQEDFLRQGGVRQAGHLVKLNLSTSRGCPFRCTFCHNSQGKTYRQRPLDDFFREIEFRLSRTGLRDMMINDDLLAEDKERLREFCQGMRRYGCKGWFVSLRAPQVDEENIELLQEAGCGWVGVGLESASDFILKSMKKGITRVDIERALNVLHRAGMPFNAKFIFGDPEETAATARETLDWWDAHPQFNIMLTQIILFPGSALYKKALAEGKIPDPRAHLIDGFPLINVSKMSDDEYSRLTKELNQKMQSRLLSPEQQLGDMVVMNDFSRLKKKITGSCRFCGAPVGVVAQLSATRCVCPECGAPVILPAIDEEGGRIGENLKKLLDKYGPACFWGIGDIFKQLVLPECLDDPRVHLVDRFSGAVYGGKKVCGPEIIKEVGIKTVIVSVALGSVAYDHIRRKAADEYQAWPVLSLYQLLADDFQPEDFF